MASTWETLKDDLDTVRTNIELAAPIIGSAGNVFLCAASFTQEQLLINEYYRFLQGSLNYNDLQAIAKFLNSYRSAVYFLIFETDSDKLQVVPDLYHEYLNMNREVKNVLAEFVVLTYLSQKAQLYVLKFMHHDYALRVIPNREVQEGLVNIPWQKMNLNDNQFELTPEKLADINLASPKLLKELQNLENLTHYYSLELAIATEVNQKLSILQDAEPTEMEPEEITEFLATQLEKIYRPLYTAIYKDFYALSNPITSVSAKMAITSKQIEEQFLAAVAMFPSIFEEEDLELLDFEPTEIVALISENVKDLEIEFWDWQVLKLYGITFLPANIFEQEVYSADVVATVTWDLNPKQSTVVATLALLPSIESVQNCADIICGENYNEAWQLEVLSNFGVSELGQIALTEEEDKPIAMTNSELTNTSSLLGL